MWVTSSENVDSVHKPLDNLLNKEDIVDIYVEK